MSIDEEAKRMLTELREKTENSIDGGIYGDQSKALKDIDSLLASPSTEGVKFLLLPTANLQALSIENGWGQEFEVLASKLEKLLDIS